MPAHAGAATVGGPYSTDPSHMASIREVLAEDHRRCDELFAQAEELAAGARPEAASVRFAEFERAMERHLGAEEQVLFPAFEQASGERAGPTAVMRSEHAQMRALLGDMHAALARADSARFLGLAETLLVLMQQHNLKEEQILYRLADQVLAHERDALLARLFAD
jgi:hemerythrin-like domain-containing protein